VPSVELWSATTSSKSVKVCASTERTVWLMKASLFQAGRTTETRGTG
jgi:hypothetical protein